MKLLTSLLVVPVLAVFAIACGGDDDAEETPTSVPSVEAPTEVPGSPTAEATATSAPGATNTPGATPDATGTPAGTPFPGTTDAFEFDAEGTPAEGNFVLTDVRVGEHTEAGGYDRIVFEFEDEDGHPGGVVEYVDEASQCGSGMPVEVEGDAILAVRFDMSQAHDEGGNLTIDGVEVDGPGTSILQAVSYCDFEGVVQWAIGVPSELEFNVTILENASRIVIDVQHP